MYPVGRVERALAAVPGVEDPSLANDGWLVFGIVQDNSGTPIFDPGTPPTSGRRSASTRI